MQERNGGGYGTQRKLLIEFTCAYIQHKLLFVELFIPTFLNTKFSEIINMQVSKTDTHSSPFSQSTMAMQKMN